MPEGPKPKPNLFHFATSELSQDAFLCWLASWAAPEAAHSDPDLHKLGRDFLAALLEKRGHKLPETIIKVELLRQYKKIDVLIKIDSHYTICIEDKVGTTEHSDQLARYVEALKSDGVPESRIIPIYVQTYEQLAYTSVKKAGYHLFDRQDLIELLRPYAEKKSNAIVRDFYDHLSKIDQEVNAFSSCRLHDWPWLAWQGFFRALREKLRQGLPDASDAEWGYVPNRSGGFMGFWWSRLAGDGCHAYIQLEEEALCFKISVDDAARRRELRDRWMNRILQAARDVDIVRPARLGHGGTMTVARFRSDYRAVDGRGILDMERTVGRLRDAMKVLGHAAGAAGWTLPSTGLLSVETIVSGSASKRDLTH